MHGGRIRASVDCEDGDAAERILTPKLPSFVVSDDDWRGMQYRRALPAPKYERIDPLPRLARQTLKRLDTR